MRLRLALPVAAVAGLALNLAYQPTGWWPMALVGVGLSLATLIGRSVGAALLVGVVFGAVFYGLHLAWVGQFLGPIPRLALSGLEALLTAAGAVPIVLAYRWTARGTRRSAAQLILVPLLIGGIWVSREVVIGAWPYNGFPWARLGMTQVDGPFREVASWTGVTGLSFLIAVVAAGLLQWARAGGWRFGRGALPAAITVSVMLIVPQFPTTDAGTFTVGWVQGNGPAGYFDQKNPGDVLVAQKTVSERISGARIDLLVWPEGSVDSDAFATPDTAATLTQVTTSVGAPLLANGATTRDGRTFNTSFLWDPSATNRQLHDKVNPVPFGEYVPDRWFYERLVPDLVGLIQREYTPGSNAPVVNLRGVPIGLAICFDVIFDRVIWDGFDHGAQLYVFQTNNADFRGSSENLQQLAFAKMRAIETGRAVVNISTVGTSQALSPDGTVIDTLPVDTAAGTVTTLPLRTGRTPASVIGPRSTGLFPLLSVGAMLSLGIIHRRRRPRDPADAPAAPEGRSPVEGHAS